MPTDRTYHDACGMARALDVVGERWALLVIRELLLGPHRFTDLRHALPGASSNLVADRVRELEGRGVVSRRKLPPPASSWVYELTPWGRELEPIMLALGDWGVCSPLPPEPVTLSATSALLALRRYTHPAPGAPACRIELDGQVWTAESTAGQLHIRPGEPAGPGISLRTDPKTLAALVNNPTELDAAMSDGRAVVTGDTQALRQLLASATIPSAATASAGS